MPLGAQCVFVCVWENLWHAPGLRELMMSHVRWWNRVLPLCVSSLPSAAWSSVIKTERKFTSPATFPPRGSLPLFPVHALPLQRLRAYLDVLIRKKMFKKKKSLIRYRSLGAVVCVKHGQHQGLEWKDKVCLNIPLESAVGSCISCHWCRHCLSVIWFLHCF